MKMIILLLIVFGINTVYAQKKRFVSRSYELCDWDSLANNWVNCSITKTKFKIRLDKKNKTWYFNNGDNMLEMPYIECFPHPNIEGTIRYNCAENTKIFQQEKHIIVILYLDEKYYNFVYFL